MFIIGEEQLQHRQQRLNILWIDFAGITGNGVVGSPLARSNQMYEEFNPRLRDEPLNKGEKNALKAALAANGDALTGYSARVLS